MTESKQDIALSMKARRIAERFVAEGYFQHLFQPAVFAAAYVLRNEFSSFNPATYTLSDTSGFNNSYGTFDSDGSWSVLLTNLYKTETPRLYFQNLMNYGLEEISDMVELTGSIQIAELVR